MRSTTYRSIDHDWWLHSWWKFADLFVWWLNPLIIIPSLTCCSLVLYICIWNNIYMFVCVWLYRKGNRGGFLWDVWYFLPICTGWNKYILVRGNVKIWPVREIETMVNFWYSALDCNVINMYCISCIIRIEKHPKRSGNVDRTFLGSYAHMAFRSTHGSWICCIPEARSKNNIAVSREVLLILHWMLSNNRDVKSHLRPFIYCLGLLCG